MGKQQTRRRSFLRLLQGRGARQRCRTFLPMKVCCKAHNIPRAFAKINAYHMVSLFCEVGQDYHTLAELWISGPDATRTSVQHIRIEYMPAIRAPKSSEMMARRQLWLKWRVTQPWEVQNGRGDPFQPWS